MLHHEVRSRQGRPHGLGACTWQAELEVVTSVRRMLHVQAGERLRRKAGRSDEAVMTPEGARKARSITRVVQEQRYEGLVKQAIGVPWDEEGDRRDGEPSVILQEWMQDRAMTHPSHHLKEQSRGHSPTGRVYVTNDALMKFGYDREARKLQGVHSRMQSQGRTGHDRRRTTLRVNQAEAQLAGAAAHQVAEVEDTIRPAKNRRHGETHDVDSPTQMPQHSSSSGWGVWTAPLQRSRTNQLVQDRGVPLVETVRVQKRAGGDVKDIDRDALLALYKDVTKAWIQMRTQISSELGSRD